MSTAQQQLQRTESTLNLSASKWNYNIFSYFTLVSVSACRGPHSSRIVRWTPCVKPWPMSTPQQQLHRQPLDLISQILIEVVFVFTYFNLLAYPPSVAHTVPGSSSERLVPGYGICPRHSCGYNRQTLHQTAEILHSKELSGLHRSLQEPHLQDHQRREGQKISSIYFVLFILYLFKSSFNKVVPFRSTSLGRSALQGSPVTILLLLICYLFHCVLSS